MKRALWVAAGVCAVMAGVGAALYAQMSADLKAVVETDRAFAEASVAKGTRDAFLAFLADDSLLFRPQPVPAKMFTRNRPTPPGKLTWAPMFADAASSSDIAYTTGPFEFRKGEMTETPASYGHYLSVWRKQKDGQWRMEASLTSSHEKFTPAVADVKEVRTLPAGAAGGASGAGEKPGAVKPADTKPGDTKPGDAKPAETKPGETKAPSAKPADPTGAAAPATGTPATSAPPAPGTAKPGAPVTLPAPLSPAKQAEQALKDVDIAFAKLAADQGSVKAFQATAADGIRLHRDGVLPMIGKAGLEKVQPSMLGSAWQPAHARMSASGDFGYTTGAISLGSAPTPGSQQQPHFYLRIWRKDKAGAWKLHADMVN